MIVAPTKENVLKPITSIEEENEDEDSNDLFKALEREAEEEPDDMI